MQITTIGSTIYNYIVNISITNSNKHEIKQKARKFVFKKLASLSNP